MGVVTKTLSSAAMLKYKGQLLQNVNYAVKSAYLAPLLADVPTVQPATAIQTNADWAAEYEDSVVLIIAR